MTGLVVSVEEEEVRIRKKEYGCLGNSMFINRRGRDSKRTGRLAGNLTNTNRWESNVQNASRMLKTSRLTVSQTSNQILESFSWLGREFCSNFYLESNKLYCS